MNKNTLLLIIVLILFSNKLWNIIWDMGKGLLYILILIQGLKYLNIPLGNTIKDLTNNIINYNPDKIKQVASSFSKELLNSKSMPETIFSNKKFDVSFDDGINDNRNFFGRTNTNRKLNS
jgi:hypothetical protein